MDSGTRAFAIMLLQENAALAEQAGCALGVAALLQQLMTNHGDHLGLPSISPDLPLPILQDCARRLAARLSPLEAPTTGHNGQRVPMGAGSVDKDG